MPIYGFVRLQDAPKNVKLLNILNLDLQYIIRIGGIQNHFENDNNFT